MIKLLPVTIISFIFAAISHYMSDYDQINGTYRQKERLFCILTAMALGVFGGLRYIYNDTHTYLHIYDTTVQELLFQESLFDGLEWLKVGDNPGFYLLLRILVRLGCSSQTFLMLFSVFTVGVNVWFFRKYSCNFFLSIILFVCFAGYTLTMAAVKQCAAMSICLIATDRAIRKKYLSFLLLILLSCTIHPYSLMYLAVPFLFFRPWSKYTVFALIIFAIIGISLEALIGTIVDVTDMLGEDYDAEAFLGEGVNPIRLLVTAVPVGLSLLNVQAIRKHEEKEQYLMVNLTMLNAEIMFVALFGTANFFARLSHYFLPFQAVSLPWLFKQFHMESKRTITVVAIVCYLLFFVFTNVHENFDLNFHRIGLVEYIASLFEGIF